jgi:hypothetical protein
MVTFKERQEGWRKNGDPNATYGDLAKAMNASGFKGPVQLTTPPTPQPKPKPPMRNVGRTGYPTLEDQ